VETGSVDDGWSGDSRVGIVGAGEVGSGLVSALLRRDFKVKAYDIDQERARARLGTLLSDPRLELAPIEEVAAQGKVISAVIPTTALDCAVAVVSAATDGLCYLDLNSAGPAHKHRMREIVEGVPGSVMTDGTIGGGGFSMAQGPLFYLAGEGAKDWAALLAGLGFRTEVIGSTAEDVGRASELKMVRTAFTKGYEALIEESLLVAEAMGLLEEVVQSIGLTLDGLTFVDLARHFTSSHAQHANRRAGEVAMSLETIREALPAEPTPVLEGVLRRYELDTAALGEPESSAARAALHHLASRLASTVS